MCDLVLFEVRCTCFYLQKMLKNTKNAFFCTFLQKNLVMYSGYALAFYDAVVSSDAALVCTMFDQFPRSYGRKMQPMTPIFPTKCTFFEKNCIFFKKYLVMCIFCCTFALAFEKEVRHTVTVLSSSGLGQRPLTP